MDDKDRELVNKTLDIISRGAEAAGDLSSKGFQLMVKTTMVNGIAWFSLNLILSAILMYICIRLIGAVNKSSEDTKNFSDYMWFILVTFFLTVAFMFGAASYVSDIFSPEGVVLASIIRNVRGH